MKMKKILSSIIALSSVVMLTTGCQDFLDKTPSTALSTDIAITNIQDAQTALVGLYDGVQGSSSRISWYGAQQLYRPDVAGDLMCANGSGKRCSSSFELGYTAPASPNIWNIPYNVIRRANNIIKAIDDGKVTDGSPADVNHIKGQALTIRALAHFDLARNYGKPYTADNGASLAAPIVTEALLPDATPARNTVAEVYTQVIKDLKDAIGLMGTDKKPGYLNQQGAKALLARVYLYKGENQLAFDTAVDLIEKGKYSLWTNAQYAGAWAQQGTSEVIWEIVNFNSADWTDREGIAYLMDEAGYGDMILSKKACDYFNANPNDVRIEVTKASSIEANKKNYGTNRVWLLKYPSREGQTDIRVGNIVMLRLSEQYLIAAEAAIKLGDQPNADKYLNDIIKRANPDADDVTATLDNILWERGIELIGEGHRLYDLMRNNMESDRSGNWANVLIPSLESVKFNRDYFRVLLAIPQSELNTNPSIIQNPGYAAN